MATEYINDIVDELKKHGKMYFLEAATENQIELFEKEKEVKLPSKYKEWLRYSDGGDLFLPAGVQLYGVSHKPIIDVNEDDRPDEKYVVIGTLASGEPVLCEKGSEKISIYSHEEGKIYEEEIYSDFYEFLKDVIDSFGSGE